jgi:hypothetical protein
MMALALPAAPGRSACGFRRQRAILPGGVSGAPAGPPAAICSDTVTAMASMDITTPLKGSGKAVAFNRNGTREVPPFYGVRTL